MTFSSTLRHYLLVRNGLRAPRPSDHIGTGLGRDEVETALIAFYASRVGLCARRQDGGFGSRELREICHQTRLNVRHWSIHVADTDSIPDERNALGQVLFHGRGSRSPFPNVPANTKHLILIRTGQSPISEFMTLLHEVSHVVLGHVGIGNRRVPDHATREVEAELASLLASRRNGFDGFRDAVTYLHNRAPAAREVTWETLRRIGRAVSRLDQLTIRTLTT